MLDNYDIEKLKSVAGAAAKEGRTMITFKCSGNDIFALTIEKLFTIGNDWILLLDEAHKEDNLIDNSSCIHWQDDKIRTISIKLKP